MVVKCPNCGQQLRGEPGAQGKCPKCQTQLVFPQGDSQYGEPVYLSPLWAETNV